MIEKLEVNNIERYIKLNNILSLQDTYILKLNKEEFVLRNNEKIVNGQLLIYVLNENNIDIAFIYLQIEKGLLYVENIFILQEYENINRYKHLLYKALDIRKNFKLKSIKFIGIKNEAYISQALEECGFRIVKEHIQMEKNLNKYFDINGEEEILQSIKTFNDIRDYMWIYDFMKQCMQVNPFNYDIEEIIEITKEKSDLNVVIFEDGMPIGFVISYINKQRNMQENKNVIYIEEIAVHRNFRNKGFGTKLLKYVLNKGMENSMDTARLHVYKDNITAYSLYESLGFKEIKSLAQWKNSST